MRQKTSMNHQVIQPIIRQHAANAAFYWLQKEESRFSPLVKSADLRQFNQYIDANLEGLHVAGDDGWEESYAALRRWHSQGEAFVCGFLANQCQNPAWMKATWSYVSKYADTTLNGYVSALSHSAKEHVYGTVNEFLLSSIPSEVQIALNICSQSKLHLSEDFLIKKLDNGNIQEKVAVLDYIRKLGLQSYLPALTVYFGSNELSVRFSAVSAACWLSSDKSMMINPLCLLIDDYLTLPPLRGIEGIRKNQQTEMLVRLLGQCCSELTYPFAFISGLPEYLQIIFYAHYANTKTLPLLLSLMEKVELSRIAFVAVSLITGIDIDDKEYLLPAKDEKLPEITSRLNVFGTGIGMPDIHKVTSMCQQYRNEERLFLGKSVTASWCNTNFSDGSQLVRWIASWHLFHLDKNTSPKDNLLNY